MFRTRISRAILAGALLAGGGAAVTATAGPANAGTGHQVCNINLKCFNAWGGGPLIKDYSIGAANNDFTFYSTTACNNGFTTSTCPSGFPGGAGKPIVNIQFTGGGTYNGYWICDYQNNSGDAKAGLCSAASGWGGTMVDWTNDNTNCSSGYEQLWDIHWRGFFGSPDGTNGNQQYLNNGNADCEIVYNPA